MEFLDRLAANWDTVVQAPSAFAILAVAAFLAALATASWRYRGVIDNLRSDIESLKNRLHERTEQVESYKERALKFDEHIAAIVDSDAVTLRDRTIQLVANIREFIGRYQQESNHFPKTYPGLTDEERQREWDRDMQAAIRSFQTCSAEYDRRFKVDAMLLRDELRSRVPSAPLPQMGERIYEHPTNFFGYAAVADDLERLAKLIPMEKPRKSA
jgi:hypothetical protein